MAPVHVGYDASAGHVGRAVVSRASASTQKHQGRYRDPDLRRLLPALRVRANLGSDWCPSLLSRFMDCAGLARLDADLRAARAAARPEVAGQDVNLTRGLPQRFMT